MRLFKIFISISLFTLFTIMSCNEGTNQSKRKTKTKEVIHSHNSLTPEEVAGGWELLYDGKSTRHWRGYNQSDFPKKGWYIDVEKNLVGESEGSIVTKNRFVNFDLKLEFKLSEETNSGIFYKIKEIKDTAMWVSGLEYELVHPKMIYSAGDIPIEKHSTADVYDLFSKTTKIEIPRKAWNSARVVVLNNYVEHWLNDKLYLEYKIGDENWNQLVPQSKFRNYPFFGKTNFGNIGLQQDIGTVKFRNIKIKEL